MKRMIIESDADRAAAEAYIEQRAQAGEGDSAAQDRLEAVRAIVDAVRDRGDEAVAEFTARFDRVELTPDQFELTQEEIEEAASQVDRGLLAALERAHYNIRRFHMKHIRESWEEVEEDGSVLGQRITPIDSAGVYVPGGTAFYPSSVLMNLVPASVAGVPEIVMVSPPSYGGRLFPLVVAAARLAGATRVFRIGGAQAVAALAYGTEHVPTVLKITGPGNAYVTLAKRLVSTRCDIDKEAGPSEIVVVADDKARPDLVAIELMCQAEHDEDASVSLMAMSEDFVEEVERAIQKELRTLSRAATIQKALDAFGAAFVVRSLDEAAELTDLIAPEHLSLQVEFPNKLFSRIRNAGAVMLGAGTPVALGDYYAGPNHILPTGRRARYASPLTVEDFRKVTSIIGYSKEKLAAAAEDVRMLAEAESLTAHARAVEMRL